MRRHRPHEPVQAPFHQLCRQLERLSPMSRDTDSPDAEPIAYVIGRGRAADFLTRLAFPAIALPPRSLYRVVVRGHGFELPIDGEEPVVAFRVTFYVAARTADEAGMRAMKRASDRWETFYYEARGELVVAVDQVERLHRRFVRRSRSGMSFYGADRRSPSG